MRSSSNLSLTEMALKTSNFEHCGGCVDIFKQHRTFHKIAKLSIDVVTKFQTGLITGNLIGLFSP